MPKGINLKSFGRRKSSGNVLDVDGSGDAPAQSSFRVIERPEKKISYGADAEVKRGFASPLQALRGKSTDNLALSQNRGSAGTTNSGSSGYYASSSASAKHSSTSTLPSSLEQDREPEDEELFPAVRKTTSTPMHRSVAPEINDLPPPPSFSTRAARAFSFGSKSKPAKDLARDTIADAPPLPPPHAMALPSPPRAHSPQRERALTTSSYASTAVPTQTRSELTLDASDFGQDDFGSMFDNMKRNSAIPTQPPPAAFHRTESEPLYPPRTHSRQALTPSPNSLSRRNDSESPYAYNDRDSSAMSSPSIPDSGEAPSFLKGPKAAYSLVPNRQSSPSPSAEESLFAPKSAVPGETNADARSFPNRQMQLDDEDRWVKRIELRDPQGPSASSPASNHTIPAVPRQPTRDLQAAASTSPRSYASPTSTMSRHEAESSNATPRAAKRYLQDLADESLFDTSPAGSSIRAMRPVGQDRTSSSKTTRRMTREQFQMLQRRGNYSSEHSEEEDDPSATEALDDEDDVERARKMATQRRKQEANMSVYRQQMKKVTGGGPTDLPSGQGARPDINRGSSAPTLGGGFHLGGIGGTPPAVIPPGKQLESDEDEDVPLGILQAHGFPSNTRPPARLGENDLDHQRRMSMAGSTVGGAGGGQGGLPPFARRLPADPYFGAGIVNQTNRESLAMNSAASAYGGMSGTPPPVQGMGHPGGLVGVIAGEERARAARRGSPNPHAGFGTNPMNTPLPPNMPRTMSAGNLPPPPMNFMGMPQMPMMPMMGQMPTMDASQQQLQQFLQMQMQMMQNMIQMQQASMGGGQASPQMMMPQQPVTDYLSAAPAGASSRPISMASQSSMFQGPNANAGRSMTMTALPNGWNNVSQSRPASTLIGSTNNLAPSMSNLNLAGAGPGPGYTPSIAPSERSNVGMPGRYRPVSNATPADGTGRSHSMTSSMTLQAFTNQQASPDLSGTPFAPMGQSQSRPTSKIASTIRVVDKPKGGPRASSRPPRAQEDEDEGWADLKKKREDRKRSRFLGGKHSRQSSLVQQQQEQQELGELYQGLG